MSLTGWDKRVNIYIQYTQYENFQLIALWLVDKNVKKITIGKQNEYLVQKYVEYNLFLSYVALQIKNFEFEVMSRDEYVLYFTITWQLQLRFQYWYH